MISKNGEKVKISKKRKDTLTKWALNQMKCAETDLIHDLRKGDDKYFDLKEVEYPFGKRKVFFQKDQEKYELLQGTRALAVPRKEDNFNNLIEASKEWMESINDHDLVRINELEHIRKEANWFPALTSIAEIGFRTPRLLKHYLEKGCNYAEGYDVLEANVIAAEALGYDAKVYDLNACDKDLDLKGIDLVLSYHVLEHVSDPHKAIKKIYDAMTPGAFFHVEIPIEPGVPNIRYCHLFPFHPGDIKWMLQDVGFKVLSLSNQTHEGGPYVERHLVVRDDIISKVIEK